MILTGSGGNSVLFARYTGGGGGGDSVLVNKKEWGGGILVGGGGGFCPTLCLNKYDN